MWAGNNNKRASRCIFDFQFIQFPCHNHSVPTSIDLQMIIMMCSHFNSLNPFGHLRSFNFNSDALHRLSNMWATSSILHSKWITSFQLDTIFMENDFYFQQQAFVRKRRSWKQDWYVCLTPQFDLRSAVQSFTRIMTVPQVQCLMLIRVMNIEKLFINFSRFCR